MNFRGKKPPFQSLFAFFLLGIVFFTLPLSPLQAADSPNSSPSTWNSLFGDKPAAAPEKDPKKTPQKKSKSHKESNRAQKNTAPSKADENAVQATPVATTPAEAPVEKQPEIATTPAIQSPKAEVNTNLSSAVGNVLASDSGKPEKSEPFWKGWLSAASSSSPLKDESAAPALVLETSSTPEPLKKQAESQAETITLAPSAKEVPATESPSFWQKLFGAKGTAKGKPEVSSPSKAPEKPSEPQTGSAASIVIPAAITPPSAASSAKVNFSLANVCERDKCELMLLFDAPIDKATVEKFEQGSATIPAGTTVLMNSISGDFNSGLRLGQYLRQKRFNTRVGRTDPNQKILGELDGRCFSACVMAFAGGVNRRLDPGDQLGIYALRSNSKSVNDAQFKAAINSLGSYFDQMGVDRRLVDQMLLINGSSVSLISLNKAKLLNLDNRAYNQTQSWKMQALEDGVLIALDSEKQASGRFSITLGMTRQNKDFRLTVFVKPLPEAQNLSQLAEFLNRNSRLQLSVANQILAPNPLKAWEATSSGVQTAVLLSDKEVNAITSVLEFELAFTQINNNPFGLDSVTPFGSLGLKGAVNALRK